VRPRVLEDGTHLQRNPEEVGMKYDVFWANGTRFNMYSPTLRGELAALINLRDGNGGNFATFQTAGANAPTVDSGPPNVLTMHFAPGSRVDMGQTGSIAVRNPASGVITHFHYDAFELVFDPVTGAPVSGRFTLVDDTATAAAFTGSSEITIGRTSNYMGIPYFKARLNEMVRTLAAAFNKGQRLNGEEIAGVIGHLHGFDLNGLTGIGSDDALLTALMLGYRNEAGAFQTWDGNPTDFNYFNITAENFSVNPMLLSQPHLLRLSGYADTLPSGHHMVLSWANIKEDRGLFREGRLGDFIAAITGDLGVTGRQAESFSRSYGELMVTIDNQRRAVSSVSLDEEVAFMIQHQLVFQAAARLFSVIDGIYDTMINRMGSW